MSLIESGPGDGPGRDAVIRAAERLGRAARDGVACAPVRDLLDPADVAAAYAVQRRLTRESVDRGRRVVGAKIGLTSAAVQRQLGVDSPDSGVLFADMAREQDQEIDPSELLAPRIEAEVAFVLGADLDRADLDRPDLDPDEGIDIVRGAVAHAVAALEIVDSRITGWDITLVDTVADNASCGLYVIGSRARPLAELDLPAAAMSMTATSADTDGQVVSTGSGAACLGDPCAALLWLARTARAVGAPLRAGDLVLSGALGPMVPVTPDTSYEASIDGLGTVRATFGKGNP